jgi:RNA polymerase sigma factor (sigma-70 family)
MLSRLVMDRTDAGTLAVRAEDWFEARSTAFARLVDGGLDRAYRLAAVILRDPVEAEDATHDAALLAWRRWDELRDPIRFEAWFGRILVNACRDRLRARRRRLVGIGRFGDPSTEPDIAEAVERRDRVARTLDRLPADERIVVALRYGVDLPAADIAALLGCPEGTVKSRLHRALRRLRDALEATER